MRPAVIRADLPPWLVFYGTMTTIVRAPSEHKAWVAFAAAWAPSSPYGHLARPVRAECSIRRVRESDRGWIEESRDPTFIALLKDLTTDA